MGALLPIPLGCSMRFRIHPIPRSSFQPATCCGLLCIQHPYPARKSEFSGEITAEGAKGEPGKWGSAAGYSAAAAVSPKVAQLTAPAAANPLRPLPLELIHPLPSHPSTALLPSIHPSIHRLSNTFLPPAPSSPLSSTPASLPPTHGDEPLLTVSTPLSRREAQRGIPPPHLA